MWYQHGIMTRGNNKPSCIEPERNYKCWTDKKGEYHRDRDQPSVTSNSHRGGVIVEYYKHGKLHRDGDKPAFKNSSVTRYYKNGLQHRDGDKPAVIKKDGHKWWMRNGQMHRKIGPFKEDPQGIGYRIISFKGQQWFQHGIPIDKPDNLISYP